MLIKNFHQDEAERSQMTLLRYSLQLVNDTVPEVREASFEALGTAMFVVTERNIMPFVGEIEALKLTKIKEKAAALAADANPKAAEAAASAARPSTAPAAPAAASGPPRSAVSAGVAKAAAGAPRPSSSASNKKKPVAKTKKAAVEKSSAVKRTETPLSDDAVEERATSLYGEALLKQLMDVAWKERLAAMEELTKKVKMEVGSDIPCQLVVLLIARKPGLKDNNFQVS